MTTRPRAAPMEEHLPRFFVAAAAARGDRLRLDAHESKHVRVRRLRVGDRVALFDGQGHSYAAVIDSIARDAVAVVVTEQRPDMMAESPLSLTLAVALLKADRMEWVIEKATELGVTRVLPFACRYSLARPSAKRRARWNEIARSAAKQSGRSLLPRVEEPVALAAVLDEWADERVLFWEGRTSVDAATLGDVAPYPATALVVVGPEGGFSAEEAAAAERSGCNIIAFGPRILRADTAAIAAVALCQFLWGDVGTRLRP